MNKREVVFAYLHGDAQEPGIEGLSRLGRTLKDGVEHQRGIKMYLTSEYGGGLEVLYKGHEVFIAASNLAYVRFKPGPKVIKQASEAA